MEQRRVELRMSWREVSTAAGMSYEGLRAIRKGDRRPNAVTKGRLEDALHWEPGSIDKLLTGGDPTEAKQQSRPNPDELEGIIEDLTAVLERFRRWRRESD